MATYLYTWNPNRWNWVDQAQALYLINNGKPYDMYWSCGNTKKIAAGDTFLLMRLGVEPKGIIGCGYVSSSPYALPHWDEDKAMAGKTALRTDLLFKALSAKPIISLIDLQARYPIYKWTPESSGITISEPAASVLFHEIQTHSDFGFSTESSASIKYYAEGKSKTVTSKTYDRSPQARQDCIKHYGYSCSICGFNFEKAYGSIAANYIEVHHLRQIADTDGEYLINPIKDLRPVCANCHRILHKCRPPLSVDEMLKHIKTQAHL